MAYSSVFRKKKISSFATIEDIMLSQISCQRKSAIAWHYLPVESFKRQIQRNSKQTKQKGCPRMVSGGNRKGLVKVHKLSFIRGISSEGLMVTIADNGFPNLLSGKESACQHRRCKKGGFSPWVSKIPRKRE